MIESISLNQMQHLHEIAQYDSHRVNQDYIYVHISPDSKDVRPAIQKAIRFNGMIFLIVKSGKITFNIDMERFTLKPNDLMISGANSIITVDPESIENLDAHVLFVSTEFIHDLNFEIIILNNLPLTSHRSPLIRLNQEDAEHLIGYLELLDYNAKRNDSDATKLFSKSISRSLLTATLYQVMINHIRRHEANLISRCNATNNNVDNGDDDDDDNNDGLEVGAAIKRPRSRRMLYTHEFISLVRKHFRLEHSVRFYANKMCISPKYLSLVVKESTGRSAAEIIDEHLLLEAKNLLRFSGKNIQQVAYELNFSNQSSFGKYFKHLTGMSPSEFQNS